MSSTTDKHIDVQALTMAYGERVIQRDLNFAVRRGEVFVIMGPSGCGKSTLLNHMVGLKRPAAGAIHYDGRSFWDADEDARSRLQRRFGVLYQSGALWSSMTLAENVALPLEEYTELSRARIREIVRYKLALVSLTGFEDYYPAEISGGMRKRAGLARAMALDPDILFFDEPSAGLDPVTSSSLDDLILAIRDNMGTTVVVVTHELPSIFAIADRAVFLDAQERTQTALGAPRELLRDPPNERVRAFLKREHQGTGTARPK